LFKAIIADVPAVDILRPWGDKSYPRFDIDLDVGDPNKEEHYYYMLSYSPYDSVVAKDYPNILVTTGLYDDNVPLKGPAKWVAKLRALKTDNNLLILRTDMEGGHSNEPKRYQRWRDTAFRCALLLDLVGIKR
jgi:oligopeptidase B